MIYLQLFWSFFQVGLFSFGGGYASLPLIQHEIVELHRWLSLSEFTDLITISQMTPGPIAINSATFVGTQVAGPLGAVVATLGSVFPSFILCSLLAWGYRKYKKLDTVQGVLAGLRPAVVALICAAGLSILGIALFPQGFQFDVSSVDLLAAGLFLVGFILIHKLRWNSIWVLTGCGAVGGVLYLFL